MLPLRIAVTSYALPRTSEKDAPVSVMMKLSSMNSAVLVGFTKTRQMSS